MFSERLYFLILEYLYTMKFPVTLSEKYINYAEKSDALTKMRLKHQIFEIATIQFDGIDMTPNETMNASVAFCILSHLFL